MRRSLQSSLVYAPSKRYSHTVVPVLQFLWSRPIDEFTEAYLRSLRPSAVRVVDGGMHTDTHVWRVTVHTKDGIVRRIEQEVEIDLLDGVFEHGHDLSCKARAAGIDVKEY